jgi:AcrR family transcriptional regulator
LGPRERREREREAIRTSILDAARELFASEGYDAVTMRRIADRIEYSPTAIYFHFRDKEALIRELCDADFGHLALQLRDVATIEDPVERLRQAGIAYARFAVEYPNHYRLMFMTPHTSMGAEEKEIERGNPEQDAYAFLRMIVEEALGKKRFTEAHTDPELIAQTVWAALHGVVSLEIAKHGDDWVDWRPLEARITAMLDLTMAGLTGIAVVSPAHKQAKPLRQSKRTRPPAPKSRKSQSKR